MSEATPSAASRGQARIGKYDVIRKIGEGATSSVWLGRDTFANRDVAIKLVTQAALNDATSAKVTHHLFLTEASLAGKLLHPHIVEIYDAAIDEDHAYIVMEFVGGGTLHRFTRPDNLLNLGDVIEVVYKCSRALDFASVQGVIHRDIKPANILIKNDTDIKISDFGAAAMLTTTRTVVDGIGTPAYMSPEQHLNQKLTVQTDIYALGVVMFQLLTGRMPFQAENIAGLSYQVLNAPRPLPSEFRRDIPGEIDAIVQRAMQRELEHRYQTWQQFSDDLAAVASGTPLPKHGVLETEKFNSLRNLAFFRSFSDAELWEVLRFSDWLTASAGQTLVREGDPGGFFCILVSGEAKVARKKRLITSIRGGECFGEMAYLAGENKPRIADVVAASDVRLIKIPIKALERASEICRLNFDRSFLRVLVERLTVANSRLTGT